MNGAAKLCGVADFSLLAHVSRQHGLCATNTGGVDFHPGATMISQTYVALCLIRPLTDEENLITQHTTLLTASATTDRCQC